MDAVHAEIHRKLRPQQRLEIDGGIEPETAEQAADTGVDTFVAGFAIFGDSDPVAAMNRIRGGALAGSRLNRRG